MGNNPFDQVEADISTTPFDAGVVEEEQTEQEEEQQEEQNIGPKASPMDDTSFNNGEEEKKTSKRRNKKNAPPLTKDVRLWIINNYANMSVADMTDYLKEKHNPEVTKQQVENTWRQAKKKMEEKAQEAEENGDNETVKKINEKIASLFPEKESAPRGRGRGSQYDEIIDELLS